MIKNYVKILIGIVLILVLTVAANLQFADKRQDVQDISDSVSDIKSDSSMTTASSGALSQQSSLPSAPTIISSSNSTQSTTVPENSVNSGLSKDSSQKIAYITIDDGPSANNTPKNLDTLKKYGVKATFFVLPQKASDDIYKRILDEGHVMGNHSYSHNYEKLYSPDAQSFKNDVLKARDYIYNKLGYTTTIFRFPGGTFGRKKSMLKERTDILDELGYKYFDWNVSTADTDTNLKKYGDEEFVANLLANNIVKNTKNRKKLIILMHDSPDKVYTVKALPQIIEGLKKQGYSFDVLSNY